MTCKCITEIEAMLPEHKLDISICFSRERNTMTARTYTALNRRDNGKRETRSKYPGLFSHTFCPFCGTRYEPEAQQAEGDAA
jgi:hypothetical protein